MTKAKLPDHYLGALIEDMNDKIDLILEVLLPIPQQIRNIDLRLERVESDNKVTKAMLRDHNKLLGMYETRVTKLERKSG